MPTSQNKSTSSGTAKSPRGFGVMVTLLLFLGVTAVVFWAIRSMSSEEAQGGAFFGSDNQVLNQNALSAETESSPLSISDKTVVAPSSRLKTVDSWLDLLAQRPNASWIRSGRLYLGFEEISIRKYIELRAQSDWSLDQLVDGRPAGVLHGRSATFDIPVDGELSVGLKFAETVARHETARKAASKKGKGKGKFARRTKKSSTRRRTLKGSAKKKGGRKRARSDSSEDAVKKPAELALALTLKPLTEHQSVSVIWEEKTITTLQLRNRWERRTISIPDEYLRSGDNRLRLHFRRLGNDFESSVAGEDAALPPGRSVAAAFASIELGRREVIVEGEAKGGSLASHAGPDGELHLSLPKQDGLAFYLVPPTGARIALRARGPGELQFWASTDADHRSGKAPRLIKNIQFGGLAKTEEIDFSGFSSVPTRLFVKASGLGSSPIRIESLELRQQRTVQDLDRQRIPRNLYVMGIEGARADDVYKATPMRMPGFSRLLREGLIFRRAYANGAAAVPSHASWMSSMWPPEHLTVRGTFVAQARTLLAEQLARGGYSAVVASSNRDLNEERGLIQGFDRYRHLLKQDGGPAVDAAAVIDAAWKLSSGMVRERGKGDSPRFVYAVVSDPQAPYQPPVPALKTAEHGDEDAKGPAPHRTHLWVGKIQLGKHQPEASELAYVRELYRGELENVDRALQRLLDRIEDEGAILVVLGVHGEEFFEHGGAGHGRTLYEESLRVPLIFWSPGYLDAKFVETPVDLLDLAPTLVDLVGLPTEEDWRGRSFVPLFDDPSPVPRLLVSYLGDGSAAGVLGNYKLILSSGRGLGSQEFYSLGAMNGSEAESEFENQSASGGVALRMLRSAMTWELWQRKKWRRSRWGTGGELKPAFSVDLGF